MEEILNKAASEGAGIILDLVLTVLVPYAFVLARAWLKQKTAAIKDQRVREGVEFAFKRLEETAKTVTAEIRQKYLKRDPETGKVINSQAILKHGIKNIHARIDPEARAILKAKFGDSLADIYQAKIEQHAKGPC